VRPKYAFGTVAFARRARRPGGPDRTVHQQVSGHRQVLGRAPVDAGTRVTRMSSKEPANATSDRRAADEVAGVVQRPSRTNGIGAQPVGSVPRSGNMPSTSLSDAEQARREREEARAPPSAEDRHPAEKLLTPMKLVAGSTLKVVILRDG